jgi:hypothetical protein
LSLQNFGVDAKQILCSREGSVKWRSLTHLTLFASFDAL